MGQICCILNNEDQNEYNDNNQKNYYKIVSEKISEKIFMLESQNLKNNIVNHYPFTPCKNINNEVYNYYNYVNYQYTYGNSFLK
jgi:hypothetical protein